jgi:hypothetical protein
MSIAPDNGGATASIGTGLTIQVRALFLGGTDQTIGTWGSTSSGATNKTNTYFAATNGLLNVAVLSPLVASTAGDWATPGTWAGGVVPTAADDVAINVAVNVGAIITQIGSVTINNGGTLTATGINLTIGSLTIISGGTLTCSGVLTVNGNANITGTITLSGAQANVFAGNVMLNSGAAWNDTDTTSYAISGSFTNNATSFSVTTAVYTFSGAGQTFSGATTTSIGSVAVTGIYTNNGILTVGTALSGAGTLINGATGTLNIGGTSVITTLTATAAGNTVNYTGTGQTLKVTSYSNLTLSGAETFGAITTVTGNLTLSGSATATTGANLAISGSLTVSTGTAFTVGPNYTLAVTGTTSIAGTYTDNSTGAKTLTGNVTINSGGVWNETAVSVYNIAGSLANSGTYTASTGVHTLSGAGKTIIGIISIPTATFTGTYTNSGTLTSATLLTVTSPGILTNNGTITATTALSGTGGLTQGTTGLLSIGGTSGITTLTATATGNTVNYTGVAQTVKATTFYNLTLSGSGAKTIPNGTVISNNLSIAPTGTATASIATGLNIAANTLTIGGTSYPGTNATWGSTASAATNKNDTYFTTGTTGILTVAN